MDAGHKPADVITYLSKQYEVVDVREPTLGTNESEATLVLKRVS
jgi:hypothetical protein